MIPSVPSNFANAVAPFAPLGRQPVSEETPDLKTTTLKPLEQGAESFRGENRRSPDERANEAGEQQRLQQGRDGVQGNDYQRQREQRQQQEKAQQEQRQADELKEIQQLAARDREVRAHEQAHAAVGGKYAGTPRYETVRGPDGVAYAVAGEVPIDTSRIPDDPEATIAKAQQIRRAANAPTEPSAQDRRVAAEATRMEAEARAELRTRAVEEAQEEREARAELAEARKQEREAREQQEAERRARRADILAETGQRNIDINRRLIDIGVLNSPTPPGSLFDRNA